MRKRTEKRGRVKLRELYQLQRDLTDLRSWLRDQVTYLEKTRPGSIDVLEVKILRALRLRDQVIDRVEKLAFDCFYLGVQADPMLLEPTYRDEDATISVVLEWAVAEARASGGNDIVSVERAVAETITEIGLKQREPLVQLPPIPQLILPDLSHADRHLVKYLAENPQFLRELNPRVFEELLQEIFASMGYETELGPRSGDGGVDLRLLLKGDFGPSVILVQAKRWKERPVTIECVSALYGVVQSQNATKGVLATTSRFLPSAQRFAQTVGHRLFLADHAKLVHWIKRVAKQPSARC